MEENANQAGGFDFYCPVFGSDLFHVLENKVQGRFVPTSVNSLGDILKHLVINTM